MSLKKGFFVTGTDTGVGKTLISLGLCLHFKASYWKPVQTGCPTDSDFIQKFLPKEKIYPSSYALQTAVSPNQASEKENTPIDLGKIKIPESSFLIVEGIGGVYVPFNNQDYVIDLIQQLSLPVIIVARSGLGTLNHSFLTLETLKNHKIEVAGFILSGDPHKANKKDIERLGKVPVLLEVPFLSQITKNVLETIFKNLKI